MRGVRGISKALGLLYIIIGWIKHIVFISGACFFRQSQVKKGKGTRVYFNVFIKYPENIVIGANTFINFGCCLWGAPNGRITIGNDVLFGPNVTVVASNHGIEKNQLVRLNEWHDGNIIIEDDVWIGANSVILKDVKIGKGAIIAAGSIVNRDVPSYTVYGGVPAKFLKERL
ncbi:acyltransferase [Paenibacillus thalictri]|uniref:acyltransferase n=1 Tax=Paenibacillus thalictri TaxID=2527873 RepID=UPI0013EF53C1|nr:acyltransferase [Paenibacillus thalictri]